MFRSSIFLFVVMLLVVSACSTAAPKSPTTEVVASIEKDRITMSVTSVQAGDIKFTIANNSGKGQYVIIAPAECAADENPGTPTPECKAQFIEHSLYNQTWEVTAPLEPGEYVLESMVMVSGPLQLTKTYFTVVAP